MPERAAQKRAKRCVAPALQNLKSSVFGVQDLSWTLYCCGYFPSFNGIISPI